MIVSGPRYGAILCIQLILILLDLMINTFSVGYLDRVWHTVAFFIAQTVCLILLLILLLLSFFSTYVFKVGLVEVLVDRFRCTIIVSVVYFLITVGQYVWTLVVLWVYPDKIGWDVLRIIYCVFHRTGASVYYYYYKRAALRVSDPRFYEDMKWDNHVESTR